MTELHDGIGSSRHCQIKTTATYRLPLPLALEPLPPPPLLLLLLPSSSFIRHAAPQGPAAQTGVPAEGAAATDPAAEDATAAAGHATVGRGLGHTVHAGLDYFAQ